MDDKRLRQLERQYKLRVKTGCETCRTRRVKCDETKPECQRCTKTGRKCDGYTHVQKAQTGSPSAAASIRNSSFLVLPQKPSQNAIPRNPSRSLSPDSKENRSFYYFQSQTLPQWTEFFDSDLWSQKIMQLSHVEPAIKHGILALSTMHERFENTSSIFSTNSNDFAFVQYMQAVKHSNDLLTAHREGRVDVEKVLIACIIFTCYENLAGNYRAGNMHLMNGLRILNRDVALRGLTITASQESIANVLYRFDLQAMTFSDNASPYEFSLDSPPECPRIPEVYTVNAMARNDLVGLLRCMMWIAGIANIKPQAPEDPTWLQIYTELMVANEAWNRTFEAFLKNIPAHEQSDPKIYAGNTLLKMYSIMARTVIGTGGGHRTEMAWDAFVDSFKTMIDLAESLPVLAKPASPSASQASNLPSRSTSPRSQLSTYRSIAPNPATASPFNPPGTSTFVFHPDSMNPSSARPASTPASIHKPSSFSPSFELSPIVPLFVAAGRCRDPILRRRALALLFNSRRREGVWDSFGAGMVALQCIKIEEGIDQAVEMGEGSWLPTTNMVKEAGDVPDKSRIQDIFVSVNMPEGVIGINYLLRSGEALDRRVKF